jgi:hypothetical protein
MLNQSAVLELVRDELFPMWKAERKRLSVIDDWYRWDHEPLQLPSRASREHRWLADLAKTPWLNLVVTTVAQAMYVDGYRSPENRDNAGPWQTWQRNDFDTRQTAIHRAALAYGLAYATVLPGMDAAGPRSVLRGVSPRKMIAVYADPAEDDWPMYALRGEKSDNSWMLRLLDEEEIYYVSANADGSEFEFIESRTHGTGVCPVVRYANMLDLDGRADGEVAPLIPLAQRINKTSYDRLLTQHFNSWKVRTIAGIDLAPADLTPRAGETADQAAERVARERMVVLRQSDMLTAKDPQTKFGTLDETPLDGFVNAYNSDIDTLAAVAQVPATSLNGKVANLSADAIAELRAGLTQKVYERQMSFGKSHAQALRLAAAQEGDDVAAADFEARVTWQDMAVRSMSQAADALGKYATMLGVPTKALWSRIPGVSQADVTEWENMAAEGDALGALSAVLNQQAQQTPGL